VAIFFNIGHFMSGQVLTRFYLPMGATLIQGVCKAGFGCKKSLDTAWARSAMV